MDAIKYQKDVTFHINSHPCFSLSELNMRPSSNRASEDIIDAQNREYAERISSKTSYLKTIALDMEQEAKDHHRLLDNLDGDFDGASGLLGGTLNRVNLMMSSGRGNRKVMCYVILAVIFLSFLVYTGLYRLFTSSSSDAKNGT